MAKKKIRRVAPLNLEPIDIKGTTPTRSGSARSGENLTPVKVQQFNPVVPAPVVEPAPINPELTSEIVRQRREEPRSEGLSGIDWGALMIGATPLLTGLLTGDGATGVDVASSGLINEATRRNKIDTEERKARRKTASGGTLYKVKNEDGSVRYAEREDALGKKAYTPPTVEERQRLNDYTSANRVKAAKAVGSNMVSGKDSRGRFSLYDKVTGEKRTMDSWRNQFTPQEMKRVNRLKDQLTKKAQDDITVLEKARSIDAMLKAKNPITDETVKYIFAKLVDPGGKVTDKDVEIFGGSKAISSRIKLMKSKAIKGIIDDENREYLMGLVKVLRDVHSRELNSKIKKVKKQEGHKSGLKKKDIDIMVEDYIQEVGPPIPTEDTEPVEKEYTAADLKALSLGTIVKVNGRTFKRVKDGMELLDGK